MFVDFPCKICSDVTGESAVIEGVDAFAAFLARHCAAIENCMVDQAAIIDWIADQRVTTFHTSPPRHDTSGYDEGFIFLG